MYLEPIEQWIWLPQTKYPERQKCPASILVSDDEKIGCIYTAVRAEKNYTFDKKIKNVRIRTSADTFLRLNVNGKHVFTGPVAVGGDFLEVARVQNQFYASIINLEHDFNGFERGILNFSAFIRMRPAVLYEFSHKRGGFFLSADVTFTDGTKTVLLTDESWKMTLLNSHTAKGTYDGSLYDDEPVQAERIENVWHCLTSPLPPLCEKLKYTEGSSFTAQPGEDLEFEITYDMIYTGYSDVKIKTPGRVELSLRFVETDEYGTKENYVFTHDDDYRGNMLLTARRIFVSAKNLSSYPAEINVGLALSHYPVYCEAKTRTSDRELDLVLKVCEHTLKYCRQSIHLDSGRHCEPLACTGDYFIEAMMTAFTFGDQSLSAFDVRRTAQILRYNDGRMFHTTYSLIWVTMLLDVYMLSGDITLLKDCEDALIILLRRFKSYLGENGIIEYPPDYMFVDWLYPDNINLHHPPKALGQTVLNMFYFGALKAACKIWSELGETAMADSCAEDARRLHSAVYNNLYDKERGLFFEGLNTPEDPSRLYEYLPQNVEKRYYRSHSNVLAAYFGFFDTDGNVSLIEKVMSDSTLGEMQPYFMHFLLDAVFRNGLRERYTLQILEKWKNPVRQCPYGLVEGFIKPVPTYSFDHSHAWGGTPSYALPLALSGMKVLEAGMKRLSLQPSLLGLEWAEIQIPTPYGMIDLRLEKGVKPQITVPDNVEVIIDRNSVM